MFPQYCYNGPLTSFRWAGVATVTLLVGETKTAYQVHEAVLFEASSFFEAAFTSMFQESSERTMTLPEDDESVFDNFVNWLYHRRYDKSRHNEVADVFLQPVQLFVLADKYGVPDLKSHVLDQLIKFIRTEDWGPSLDTVAYAYRHTLQNATIRQILVDNVVWHHAPNWYQQAENDTWLRAHPEITKDIIVRGSKHAARRNDPFDGEMLREWMFEGSKEGTAGDEASPSGS